jgi:hypothetical protein
MINIWKYLKADPFLKDFLPHIGSHKYKIRGTNSKGNPTDFSKEEKKEIKAALRKLLSELKDW